MEGPDKAVCGCWGRIEGPSPSPSPDKGAICRVGVVTLIRLCVGVGVRSEGPSPDKGL